MREKRSSSKEDVTNSSQPGTCANARGLNGRDGRDGRDGSPGPRGQPGRDGRDGQAGQLGPRGEPGPARGIQGPQGEKGEIGIRGLPGPAGPNGGRGFQGPQGVRGGIGIRGLTGPAGPPGTNSGGVIYTRWGARTCSNVPGTQMVYSGRTGGSHYTHNGGGANHLCMPSDPRYSGYRSGVQGHAYMYGSEYEAPIVGTHNHNVPCAVCLATTRETVMMIPARKECPTSWTMEYKGYLMTEHYTHKRSTYECVDYYQVSIPGSHTDVNGALFYHVEADCGGMQCPPYDPEKELTCVVCTL